MTHLGLCPDEFTCSIVVRGLCDGGQIQVAARFLEGVRQSGANLNAAAYNALIDEYCKNGNLEEALATCTRMTEVGIDPNVVSYSSLIDGHSKVGNTQIAMAIYTEMVAKGIEPNVVTYTALICGHAKNGGIDAAFRLHKEMIEKGISPNAITVSVLADGLCRENRVQDAVRFVMEYSGMKYSDLHSFFSNSTTEEDHLIPNCVIYMTLIYGLYIDSQHCEAGKLFSYMRKSGMVPDSFTYTLLIRGQCMLGYVLNAMMLYADMVKIGVKPMRYKTVCPEIWSRVPLNDTRTFAS
jgi:pentatricopeptide repeat protein